MGSADLADLNLEQARLFAQPQAHPYVELQVQEKQNLNTLKQWSGLTTLKVYLCISLCISRSLPRSLLSLSQYLCSSFLSRCALAFFCRFFCDTKPLQNVDASRRVQRAAPKSNTAK
jgi:hypothetical protein